MSDGRHATRTASGSACCCCCCCRMRADERRAPGRRMRRSRQRNEAVQAEEALLRRRDGVPGLKEGRVQHAARGSAPRAPRCRASAPTPAVIASHCPAAAFSSAPSPAAVRASSQSQPDSGCRASVTLPGTARQYQQAVSGQRQRQAGRPRPTAGRRQLLFSSQRRTPSNTNSRPDWQRLASACSAAMCSGKR